MDKSTSLWDDEKAKPNPAEPSLVVDVTGFEGPLDLLLDLARNRKLELTKVSIVELAEQYLTFIEKIRKMRLEIAADYLVMAAWLAFLKSKLLLPEPEEPENETGEELAEMLAFRLKRLQAMRDAATSLMNRDLLGRDIHARGAPEAIEVIKKSAYSATLYDLLTAYAIQRQRQSVSVVRVQKRAVWTLEQARTALLRLIGQTSSWTRIDQYLLEYVIEPGERKTFMASSFSASLEMAKEGRISIRQTEAFAPLYVRNKKTKEEGGNNE